MMLQFHKRNKRINENQEKKEETTQSQLKEQNTKINKWFFPLVFLIPPKHLSSKVKIICNIDKNSTIICVILIKLYKKNNNR